MSKFNRHPLLYLSLSAALGLVFASGMPSPTLGQSPPAKYPAQAPQPAPAKAQDKPIVVDPKADPKAVVDAALKAYKAGKYGDAAQLLAGDLQNHPEDGQVHYYLGLALKKAGYDMPALNELEKAAKLCPPSMIKHFADEQIGNLDEPEPLEGKNAGKAPTIGVSGNDWFANFTYNVSNSVTQMFGGKPLPPPKPSTASTPGTISGGSSGDFSMPAFPDFMGGIKSNVNDAIKQGKRMLGQGKDKASTAAVQLSDDRALRHAGEADIMHMADIQALVDKSHAMNMPTWASSPSGLVAYWQSPEETPEWNYWIGRFKRCFQHVLLRHMVADMKDEARGAASCIFSVDKDGNLRGQVYASTADDVLTKALVQSVRDLDHSRILKFPVTSHVTGWNFKMSWNFRYFIPVAKYYQEKIKQERTVQALLKIIKEDTDAKLRLKVDEEKKAKARRLAAEKALQAKLKMKPVMPEAKTEVMGQIVSQPGEKELRAVALELKDLTPVAPDASTPADIKAQEDPFAKIDDATINNWPDLNK